MSETKDLSKIEFALKMISTYGVAVIFSSVLLGYFLAKDWKQGQAAVEATKQHTAALNNNTAAMNAIQATVKENTSVVKSYAEDLEDIKTTIAELCNKSNG